MASQEILREEPSRGSFVNDPKIRSLFFQTLVVVLLFGSIWWIVHNVIDNLQRLHIASGFYFPRAVWGEGSWLILVAFLVALAMAWFVAHRARQRQMATGQQFPVLWTSVALIVGLPVLAFLLGGMPLTFDFPKQSTFNLTGGFQVNPEFLPL